MTKITLPRLTSLTNQESAIQALNEWAESIENAIELTLSRNGQTPNTMTANLDMNSNRILNIAAPVDDNDPVRLIDVVDGIKGDTGAQGPPGATVLSDALAAIEAQEPASDNKYFYWTSPTTGAFTSIGTMGKYFLTHETVELQRDSLELGTSATLDVGTATGTVAAGDDTRFNRYVINTQNANYTLPIISAPTVVLHTSATPHAYTINPVATTAYPLGTSFVIYNLFGTGAITLTRGAGVALYINGSTTSANGTIAAGGAVTLINVASDTWIAIGPGIA